jgi:hypothetical protein
VAVLGLAFAATAWGCGSMSTNLIDGSSDGSQGDGPGNGDGRGDGPRGDHQVPDGQGSACSTSADCPSPLTCDPTTHTCVECRSNSDCPSSAPVCNTSTHTCTGGGNGSNNCTPPTSIALMPDGKQADVVPGQAFTQAYTATATLPDGSTKNVTADTFFTVSDPTLGDFSGATFTWGGDHGGHVTVSALYCGVNATTDLTLTLKAQVGAGGIDPGQSSGMFNGPASSQAACNPNLVYPPDGVLIPPNTNVIEVHFTLGNPAANLFEISFTNSATNVRVYTACTGSTAADGQPLGGGCVFELNQAEWDYIARTNSDRDPVKVQVRAVGCDGTNVASSNTRNISFAKEDLQGTLYYWASQRITLGGQNYNSGGVYRYDYGVRDQNAEPVLTPTSSANPNNLCIGCHAVSRDGRQMVFLFDDNDSDDEFSDVRTDIFDIAAATASSPIVKNGPLVFRPGYPTWNREVTEFLLSDGFGNDFTNMMAMPGAFERINPSAMHVGYAQAGTLRGTTPDWAPDDSLVAFAVPPNQLVTPPAAGFWMKTKGTSDDLWFAGASLYVASWNDTSKNLENPSMLLQAQGTENFYYPSFSPDGSLLVFNHATSGANFHNPKARVQLVSVGQSNPTPVDLAKLNDTGDLTNSWARWAPFVQTYKGKRILWITMSSTRNYGLRIVNDGQVNCYPKEPPMGVTPVFVDGSGNSNPVCSRTQLWMAAIYLDAGAVNGGTDVSFPAFFLPFQDQTTNNHLAQWAQQRFAGTCSTNSDCPPNGATAQCCDNGGCTACPTPPPPPPPTCSEDAQCAPSLCCKGGSCQSQCQGADGGVGPDAGPPPGGCNTCLDCGGQACNAGQCGACTTSSDCCAPLVCLGGQCIRREG